MFRVHLLIFFPFAMKWANKFNYYSDRLMEALSTHFPFVFVRVHSFLSSGNKSVAAIVYWTMIKINFHNKISRNEAKNKAIYNEIQWPIVLCRTVSRTYSQLFSCTWFCIWNAMHKIYFVYLFNGVVLWWCADRAQFIVVIVDVFYAAGVGVLFWLLLLIACIYCV